MNPKQLIETKKYSGKTVIVTGGTGYVGSALIAALIGNAARIIRISRSKQPSIDGVIDVVANLHDPDAWHWMNGADVLFHLAAETSLAKTAADPLGSLKANVEPVIHAINAANKSSRRPALVIAGTVTQFGITDILPVNSDVQDNPVTTYDLHKLMAEKQLNLAVKVNGISGCCLRLANVYGPSLSASGAPDRGIINKFISMALNGQ
ncbi:MAG: NAD(P)-dependent oxidoreductase, partial [Rhodospirillales bacterium]|nr:NAD(P)-dependent oxidoreductase [Rhodospirillales bacterium]